MKRKSLLFLLLAAMFAPLAMNGQRAQQTLVVANGTGTNSEIPFYGLYADDNYQHTQTIYPSSMLTEMEGGTITKLTYHLSSSVTKNYGSTFEVRLGTTSSTSFNPGEVNYISMTGSPAYSNTLSVNGTTVEFNLSTPYTYNGGNLVVDVRISNRASGYNSTSFYGESGSINYSVKNRSSSSLPTSTGTAVTFMPKTTFTYLSTDPYITLAPQAATVLTGFTETLTATYGNVSGTPTITYSSSNTSVATVSGSGTTATVMGVAPGTATITATMNGSYTATCAITVMDACQPTWTSSSYYISNFTVSKSETTLLNNSSTGTGGTTTNYYATQSIMAEPGEALSCAITMSSSGYSTYGFAMWVDFDQDGLDSDDLIQTTSSYSNSPYTITLNIPANASSGEYRMRIWGDYNNNSASDPCGAYTNGEAEDYKLVVSAGAYHITCNTTTNGTISVDHGSANAGETITVTATPETNYELTALTYNDGSDHNISFSNNQGTFTMPAADVTISATFSIMRNLPPYDLTVGTPGGHSVELGWTGVSTNTNHQCYELYFSTDPVMPQTPVQSSFIGNITDSNYELTGLTPETTYYAWVRDNCGTDGYSDWVAFTSFTTDVACPAPTNLTANQVTNNSAVINWEGNAESYNVRYKKAEAVFFEGFESGIPSSWTKIDADGDGNNWLALSEIPTVYTAYTQVPGWAHDGSNAASSPSYYNSGYNSGTSLNSNQWLITPQLNLEGTLKFYAASTHSDRDSYEVLLSTTGTATTDFTITLQALKEAPYALNDGTDDWEEVTIDLSSYAGQQGYIAIHHISADKYFLIIDDFGIYNGTWQIPANSPVSANTITLTGLDAETDYEVQVQADCGSEDGTSAWVGTTFTTLDNCALPYELNATNITAASAMLNWTGAQEAYNVRYHIAGEKLEEGFEGGSLPEGWTKQGSTWTVGQGAGTSTLTSTYEGSYNVKCSHSSTDDDYYLIMPALDLSGASNLNLSLYYANPYYSSSYENDIDGFGVYYRVNEGAWNELFYTTEKHNEWTPLTVALTGLAANYQIGFRMHDNWGGGVAIDNISLVISAGGPWVTKTNVTSPLNLDDLTPTIENGNHYLPTNYEWQVQGVDCDGNGTATDWSDMSTFTTLEGYFKPITGYGTSTGNWYLIASPIGNVDPAKVTNMLSNNYDLFYFNQAMDNEWVNYKDANGNPGAFNTLVSGKGYLYANKYDVTLVFTGSAYMGTNQDGTETVELDYTDGSGVDLPGWNLVGNPFAETAYLAGNCSFYTMNTDGLFAPATNLSIEPMEGIFVEASATGQSVTFTTTQPTKSPALNLNLSNGRKVVDRAIVRFDGGKQLSKLQFREGSTKVYIPVEGHDYAVVNCEEMGELPVSFKAEENGSYSLNLSSEEVSFAYLHLIDNMTGADVDLLETPSYSFEAKTTDYANRFKLVFATGDNSNDDNFAFFSNGSFVINNDGEATLQVIDVTGRILRSESINGCTNVNVNAASGVYMLRLINGDNVKVQKVVVK